MLLNKIAGAILVTALAAMIVSKIADTLIPEPQLAVHQGEATAPKGPATPAAKPEKEPDFATAITQADVKYGEKQSHKCMACHTLKKGGRNSQGPNLWGVVGRKRASHPGFSYSSAMKKKGGRWTYKDIYTFLKNPQAFVKGTKMTFHLSSPKQRGAVIAYLRTLSDSPLPLPKVQPVSKPAPEKTMPKPGQAPGKAKPETKTEPKKSALPKSEQPAKPAAPAKPEMKKAEPKAATPKTEAATPAPSTKSEPKKDAAPSEGEKKDQ